MSKYGINDMPRMASVLIDGKYKPTPLYRVWHNMLERVHNPRVAHYVGLTVCEEWLALSNFVAWADNNWKGNSLDKDLLIEGNRHYSPETCIFVPQWVNTLTISPNWVRDLPLGVYKNGKGFMAQLRKRDKRETVGTFRTPLEAHKAYLQAKAKYLKEIKGELDEIDERLYPALFKKYKTLWLGCQ